MKSQEEVFIKKPKRPQNAYFTFRVTKLEQFKNQPQQNKVQMAKDAWDQLSQQDRQQLQRQYQQRKELYHKNLNEWKAQVSMKLQNIRIKSEKPSNSSYPYWQQEKPIPKKTKGTRQSRISQKNVDINKRSSFQRFQKKQSENKSNFIRQQDENQDLIDTNQLTQTISDKSVHRNNKRRQAESRNKKSEYPRQNNDINRIQASNPNQINESHVNLTRNSRLINNKPIVNQSRINQQNQMPQSRRSIVQQVNQIIRPIQNPQESVQQQASQNQVIRQIIIPKENRPINITIQIIFQ